MQILIQVISSGKQSLRDAIVNDPKPDGYNLKVSEYMRHTAVTDGRSSTALSRTGTALLIFSGMALR